MSNKPLIEILQKEFLLCLPENISISDLKQKLSEHINYLITNNFNQLVSLLYHIDISESKLKALLKENASENTGDIIAELIIERQLQKIKTRQQFKQRDSSIPDEEAW